MTKNIRNKKSKIIRITALIGVVFLGFQSCISTSMMQTAKTLDKGERQISVAVSGYSYDGMPGLAPDLLFRTGISDKSDIGIGYSLGLFGHFKADYKHELWNSNNNSKYLSTGVVFDTWNNSWEERTDIAITLPIYLSINHDKKITPYFAQRFTMGLNDISLLGSIGNKNSGTNDYEIDHFMYYSGAAGLRFGENRTKWFIEISYSTVFNTYYYYYPQNQAWTSEGGIYTDLNFQVSIGLMIGNKKKK